jgi:hypothetical protein
MLDATLPPKCHSDRSRQPKLIDLADAIATAYPSVPVLDVVKRRMYRDWLRGVRPRALRITYGPAQRGAMKVDEVDDVLREQALLDRKSLLERRAV